MLDVRWERRARTWVEVLAAIIISCVLVALFVPILVGSVERAWSASCKGHLGELYRAVNLYLSPDHGNNWLPAGEPGGPFWFEKLEPLVAGHRQGKAQDRFVCTKAPPHQRGFTRDTISYGWNEHDCSYGALADKTMAPREVMLLGDSLGSGGGHAADTLISRDGALRLDARHLDNANLLFLDGHIDTHTRAEAKANWPAFALAPPRPQAEQTGVLGALAWWQWLFVAASMAVPYVMVMRFARYLEARREALAEKLRLEEEEKARQARILKEAERDAARKRFLKLIPHGPVQPADLPPAVLHLGRRSFQLQADREVTIGRDEGVGIRIHNDRMVSRMHAKIRPEPRGYVVYDLCSRSGTFVGGEPVVGKALSTGDVIRLGPLAELTFELCEQPASANR